MSELRADVLKDGAGTGSPSFPNGLAKADIANAMNAAGEAPIFACRAWVNFDGTRNVDDTGASTNGQPVLIRASGNVTSVVKNAGGRYTVNFTTEMPDANCVYFGFASQGGVMVDGGFGPGDKNASAASVSFDVRAAASAGLLDVTEINIVVFR